MTFKAEATCRLQVHVRGGLTGGNVVAADPGAHQRGVTVAFHLQGQNVRGGVRRHRNRHVLAQEAQELLRTLNQVHAGADDLVLGGEQVLHHAFMVLGVLCGGGVRLLAVLRLVGEQCKLLRDVGCCQAGEAVLDLFGEGDRPAGEKLTLHIVPDGLGVEEDAVAVEDCAAGEPIGGYCVFKHNVSLSQGFRLWKRWPGA